MARPGCLIVFLFIVALSASAQTDSGGISPSADRKLPSSLQGSRPAAFKHPSKKQKEKEGRITHEARKKYEKRLERLKRRSKRQELATAREASDGWARPNSFGHKTAPRKRSASKQKYCRVCGIYH